MEKAIVIDSNTDASIAAGQAFLSEMPTEEMTISVSCANGFTASGMYKLSDPIGLTQASGAVKTNYSLLTFELSEELVNAGYSIVKTVNGIFMTTEKYDMSTIVANSAWATGYSIGDTVEYAGKSYVFGYNAFASGEEALATAKYNYDAEKNINVILADDYVANGISHSGFNLAYCLNATIYGANDGFTTVTASGIDGWSDLPGSDSTGQNGQHVTIAENLKIIFGSRMRLIGQYDLYGQIVSNDSIFGTEAFVRGGVTTEGKTYDYQLTVHDTGLLDISYWQGFGAHLTIEGNGTEYAETPQFFLHDGYYGHGWAVTTYFDKTNAGTFEINDYGYAKLTTSVYLGSTFQGESGTVVPTIKVDNGKLELSASSNTVGTNGFLWVGTCCNFSNYSSISLSAGYGVLSVTGDSEVTATGFKISEYGSMSIDYTSTVTYRDSYYSDTMYIKGSFEIASGDENAGTTDGKVDIDFTGLNSESGKVFYAIIDGFSATGENVNFDKITYSINGTSKTAAEVKEATGYNIINDGQNVYAVQKELALSNIVASGDWTGYSFGDSVAVDGNDYYYGINAFADLPTAYKVIGSTDTQVTLTVANDGKSVHSVDSANFSNIVINDAWAESYTLGDKVTVDDVDYIYGVNAFSDASTVFEVIGSLPNAVKDITVSNIGTSTTTVKNLDTSNGITLKGAYSIKNLTGDLTVGNGDTIIARGTFAGTVTVVGNGSFTATYGLTTLEGASANYIVILNSDTDADKAILTITPTENTTISVNCADGFTVSGEYLLSEYLDEYNFSRMNYALSSDLTDLGYHVVRKSNGIYLTTQEEETSGEEGSIDVQGKLPESITIQATQGFDITSYYGTYTLCTEGVNAGYYVKEDGQHRFSATLTSSSKLLQTHSVFKDYISTYEFVTEMETLKASGQYSKRDDYIFGTTDSVYSLKKVGSKYSTKRSNSDASWATLDISGSSASEEEQQEQQEEQEQQGGTEETLIPEPQKITDYSTLAKTITVKGLSSFDQRSYFATYYLITSGTNAGYYVSEDGKNRFSAQMSIASNICSSSYGNMYTTYVYATEMETKYGNQFCSRDDFIFSSMDTFTVSNADKDFVLSSKTSANKNYKSSLPVVQLDSTPADISESESSETEETTKPGSQESESSTADTLYISAVESAGDYSKDYVGTYHLQTSGDNAGYYVREDGEHRFSSTMVEISQEGQAQEKTGKTTGYCVEIESSNGDGSFHNRTDYIYSATSSVRDAVKLVTGEGYNRGADISTTPGAVTPSTEEETESTEITFDGEGLPLTITIRSNDKFDCSCYFGKYTLNTSGKNAGYYVKEDGSQRFSATVTTASSICSSSFKVLYDGENECHYAVEMESLAGNGFHGRDDYMFCQSDSIADAKFVSTKSTASKTDYVASVEIDGTLVEKDGCIETKTDTTKIIEAVDYSTLPEVITISDVDGFDCKCYVGVYTLCTYGSNAGYYVDSTGFQRFSASASFSANVCSGSFSQFFDTYQYAFEMETGYNGNFQGRDDFIFASVSNLGEALADNTTLKLGTKSTIQKSGDPNWANVTAGYVVSSEEQAESGQESIEYEVKDLPATIVISYTDGFDCKEYCGTYVFTTSGSNAGYYVKEDGSHRFSATVSARAAICSGSFLKADAKYAYASEMETKFSSGDSYFKRDDFVFCTSANIADAMYVGTKSTTHSDGTIGWATVSVGEYIESETESETGSETTEDVSEEETVVMDGILISPVFSETDAICVNYSYDGGETWKLYDGNGIATILNRTITFRVWDKKDSYKDSSFILYKDENDTDSASSLKWSSVVDEEETQETYTLEVSEDDFATSMKYNVSSTDVANIAMTQGRKWRVLDKNGIGISIVQTQTEDTNQLVKADENGEEDSVDILWGNKDKETWESGYQAENTGSYEKDEESGETIFHEGTHELVSIAGKNRFTSLFEGGNGASVLNLTDDECGDALFIDDVYSDSYQDNGKKASRLKSLSEIYAGVGDDVVDMTSERFEYGKKTLAIHGGQGDDVIWANSNKNILLGDEGDDKLTGGHCADVLSGGVGDDTLTCGGGTDIVCFCENWGKDIVSQDNDDDSVLTLWFKNADAWNNGTLNEDKTVLTYNDNSITLENGWTFDKVQIVIGENKTKTKGKKSETDLTLEYSYDELDKVGAFSDYSSQKIFEERKNVFFTSKS